MGKSFGANIVAAIRNNRIPIITICTIVALRLVFIGVMGLMPQDAYYDFYGEHLALSYYDHPPAIAWLLRLFTTLLGKNVFALKLADTVITCFTILIFYRLAAYFLSPRKVMNALLLLYSTTMVTVLSLVSTPDVPLMLCWALALLFLYRALFLEWKASWIWAGLMMGLAFDSKYTGIFLPAGMLLFLLLSAPHSGRLRTPWPWLALLCFSLAILPVVIWNWQHDFVSFRFQSSNRVSSFHLNLLDFLGVIGHQAALLLPVLFFALLYFSYRATRKYRLSIGHIPARTLFLLCFFVPVFGGFLVIALFYWVKLNWMMPAYITGIIWVSTWLGGKYIRWQWICSLAVHLLLMIEILCYPVPIKSDDVWMGWGKLAQSVKKLHASYPQDFIFSADDYKTSAVLNFYLPQMVYGQNIIGKPALQFDYIGTDVKALKGRNALFINSMPDIKDAADEKAFVHVLRHYFDSVAPLKPIVVYEGRRPVRKFLVYRCMGYRPPHTFATKPADLMR